MEKTYSVYIHIPFCISKCRYCDFFSVKCSSFCNNFNSVQPFVPDSYVKALCNEISTLSGVCVNTVYVGGGTPSLLTPRQITKIFEAINKACVLTENAEISFEVNPDDVTEELLSALDLAGVNRISCGIQSMNDEVLKRAGRRADSAANLRALELFKRFWCSKGKKLSLDFISALPLETENTFLGALQTGVNSGASHISMYSLTIEEKTPFGQELENGVLDYDYDSADKMWLSARSFLEKNGFYQYEVSNFAKKGEECLHNLSYWNHKDYYGFGSGATGTIYNENASGVRYTITNDIKKYIEFWLNYNPSAKNNLFPRSVEEISKETSRFEFFMMGLRKLSGVSEEDYKVIFAEDFPPAAERLFVQWKQKNLAEITSRDGAKTYSLNKDGILFLNRFLEQLEL